MEINSPIKDIIDQYNQCLSNLQALQEVNCVDPEIWDKAVKDFKYQEDAREWEEFKLKSSEERAAIMSEKLASNFPQPCYDCQMQELGITLLRAIKENFSGEPKAIKTERPQDIKPEELIELMQLQAKQRDELNRGLMEEIATLRKQNTKMMADTTNHLTEIVNLKKNLELLKNNRCFNQPEKMPF